MVQPPLSTTVVVSSGAGAASTTVGVISSGAGAVSPESMETLVPYAAQSLVLAHAPIPIAQAFSKAILKAPLYIIYGQSKIILPADVPQIVSVPSLSVPSFTIDSCAFISVPWD